MKALVTISRVLVGVLFIISGLIKANDSTGFAYKLDEYFEIWHMNFMEPYTIGLSSFICVLEMVMGFMLLMGAMIRWNTLALLGMIIFFTFLTGWSTITHTVTDCGCFGDAIKLTPWESFTKDIVLLILILILFIGKKHMKPLVNKSVMGIAIFTALFVSVAFTAYCYVLLPVKDFLPYKQGASLYDITHLPPGAQKDSVDMVFIYQKAGKEYRFRLNELPKDIESYKFVDRKDEVVIKGDEPLVHDFVAYDQAGDDFTSVLTEEKGWKLLMVSTALEKCNPGKLDKIGKLALALQTKAQITVIGLTASTWEGIAQLSKEHGLGFDFLVMDQTPLKSMIRSNPGIILVKDATIIRKWSGFNIPTDEQVMGLMK